MSCDSSTPVSLSKSLSHHSLLLAEDDLQLLYHSRPPEVMQSGYWMLSRGRQDLDICANRSSRRGGLWDKYYCVVSSNSKQVWPLQVIALYVGYQLFHSVASEPVAFLLIA